MIYIAVLWAVSTRAFALLLKLRTILTCHTFVLITSFTVTGNDDTLREAHHCTLRIGIGTKHSSCSNHVTVICRCTIPIDAQHPQMHNIYRCTTPADAQYLQMHNTCRCTISVDAQHLQMHNTHRCTTPADTQYLHIHNAYRCTIPIDAQYL